MTARANSVGVGVLCLTFGAFPATAVILNLETRRRRSS